MDPQDFTTFVAALPSAHEIALTADNVSTAFYRALRAGWSTQQLIADAQSTFGRGGVGLVVTRMNALAEQPPAKRQETVKTREQVMSLPECKSCGQPYSRMTRVTLGATCRTCGDPLVLRQHVVGE